MKPSLPAVPANSLLIVGKTVRRLIDWRPAWDREGRDPAWVVASQYLHNTFGNVKYLWGNAPAIDVLQLEKNESLHYQEDIALLFAASGDLRNVVKTIADLPNSFEQNLHVSINDLDRVVVVRNVILLLLALSATDAPSPEAGKDEDISEALIHLWYSSFITERVLGHLQKRVIPLISDACDEASTLQPGALMSKTWHFPPRKSLRVELRREEWLRVKEFCEVPETLTYEKARATRVSVTLAPQRTDYRERWHFKELSPPVRVARQQFREDGLLLPFGYPRIGFHIPNPTIFYDGTTWPMDDKADPLTGWSIQEVYGTKTSAAADVYGKLFVHLRKVMKKFLDRLSIMSVDFEMVNMDAKELLLHLAEDHYTRIEVSNISDAGYLGIRATLATLTPLLQPPERNPNATLITLFLNAVMEISKANGEKDSISNMKKPMEYLPTPDWLSFSNPQGADMMRLWDSRALVMDVKKHFQKYMEIHRFNRVAADLKVVFKSRNTIIEEWPTQLKLQLKQKGAVEEFRILLGSDFSGLEHYVEWRRV
ncbi:hypothetical protein N7517_011409 [Penicillium concentricum]|uniref:DUF4470 domain-containing protein n=1 Tax=Penicillium concentricum TaxID=293559 RepID=A0A9W9UVD3_9EURO|nr:uncharacterized protein N7517_011409 [Penicillium concentricum]KAJ5356800.1 hypothetical protein N7517_011409 [Penicillium concentricum]